MELSAAEARSALDDIERTTTLSAKSTGYRRSSPYLILWGVIWMIGYAAPVLAPHLAHAYSWLALDLIGMVASALITARAPRRTGKASGQSWRIFAMAGLIAFFIVGTMFVMQPTHAAQFEVFPALVLGLCYGIVGIFGMPRFFWVACIPPVAGLLAYYLAPAALPLTLSLIGGGSLVVVGFWMRRL